MKYVNGPNSKWQLSISHTTCSVMYVGNTTLCYKKVKPKFKSL